MRTLQIALSIATVTAVVVAAGCRAGSEGGQTGVRPGSDPHQHPSTPEGTLRRPVLNTTPAPGRAPDGMVWIAGGEFWMGCDTCGMPDAMPVHLVSVSGFWMDATPVTNVDFDRFVSATKYVTVAVSG